jgi:hypothetical protein
LQFIFVPVIPCYEISYQCRVTTSFLIVSHFLVCLVD